MLLLECIFIPLFLKVVDAVWTPNSEALPFMAYVACPALKPLGTAYVVLQFPSSSSEAAEARTKHFTESVPLQRPATSAMSAGAAGGASADATFDVSTGSAEGSDDGGGSGSLTLTFSNATGLLVHASFNASTSSDGENADVSLELAQQWGYYTAYQSGLEGLDLGTFFVVIGGTAPVLFLSFSFSSVLLRSPRSHSRFKTFLSVVL